MENNLNFHNNKSKRDDFENYDHKSFLKSCIKRFKDGMMIPLGIFKISGKPHPKLTLTFLPYLSNLPYGISQEFRGEYTLNLLRLMT